MIAGLILYRGSNWPIEISTNRSDSHTSYHLLYMGSGPPN